MPIYEFDCEGCGEHHEFILKLGGTKRKCPTCGENKLKKKLFSQSNYHDTYSPMHPRRGRGKGGAGRVEPGEGMKDFGKNFN